MIILRVSRSDEGYYVEDYSYGTRKWSKVSKDFDTLQAAQGAFDLLHQYHTDPEKGWAEAIEVAAAEVAAAAKVEICICSAPYREHYTMYDHAPLRRPWRSER